MRHLNYKHLHYFWVVAREGSIARASERLFLTPQTISGQLAELETSVGERLFIRTGRGLQLTDVGRTVFRYADEMFRLGTELKEVLEGRLPGGSMEFRIGISDVVPKLLAYRILQPALSPSFALRLICTEGHLQQLLGNLAIHKLDLVLADSPISSTLNIRAFSHALGETHVVAFASPGLASRLEGPFPQCLNGQPVLLPGEHSALRRSLDHWFEKDSISPVVAGEFDDSALMKAFGHGGAGVFFAPAAIEEEIRQQFQVVTIGHTEQVRESYYAITAERRLKHPAITAITQHSRNALLKRS
jgi:LysR family transcriptional regulator, transcriptional activator of nhaA